MPSVDQSGVITPGHLAAFAADGVIQDAGVTFFNTYGLFVSTVTQQNFNSALTDYPIPIGLPVGYTRFRVEKIIISGANTSLVGATCGVFTGADGTGIVVVLANSSVLVSQSSANVVGSMQSLPINNQDTLALQAGALFFRLQVAVGVAAFADISVFYEPLP